MEISTFSVQIHYPVTDKQEMKKNLLLSLSLFFFASLTIAQTAKTENWPNGQTKSSGSYKFDVPLSANASKSDIQKVAGQIIKVGTWKYWFENGQQRAEENYTDGIRTGVQKSWYSNGKSESVLNLNTKTATFWFDNGQKQSEGAILTDGTPTGNWTAWHSNGIKNSEGTYDQVGNKQGIWKFWDNTSQLIGQQNYINGIAH
jgi:antitoxin component YwqK of YwqJK toxin-antitoxin module